MKYGSLHLKLLILAILLVGFIYFFKESIKSYLLRQQVPTNSIISCSKPEILVSQIQSKLDWDKNLVIKTGELGNNHPSFSDIPWKRSATEPFITYRGSDLSRIYFVKHSYDDIKKLFDNEIDNTMSKEGFTKNTLDTLKIIPPSIAEDTSKVYRYAYLKGDELYVFELSLSGYPEYDSQKPNQKQEDTPLARLMCANKDKKADTIYDELFATQEIKSDIDKSKTTFFSIDQIGKNIVISSVSSNMGGGFGTTDYFAKNNGVWKKIYSGQERPTCEVMEKNHADAGMECLNSEGKYILTE